MRRTLFLTAILFSTVRFGYSQQHAARFLISEGNVDTQVACNIRISDSKGNNYFPDSSYFWQTFQGVPFPEYPSSGKFTIQLKPGKYFYEADRGPEYYLAKDSFQVEGQDIDIHIVLRRLVDMKKTNWWSGEMHVHRKLQDIEMLMKASDLHVAPVITSWNEHYSVRPDSVYDGSPKKFDSNRFYTTQGSEDERNGGAILSFNTAKPVDFSKGHEKEYPPLASSVERVKSDYGNDSWIDIEKPFWWDFPILIATGKINSVGIAHNHMHKNSIFDNEAWGRERERTKYPAPMGNGLYTHDIYFKLLNCGIRIPPSAGSASGVLPNSVGYNRVYVHTNNQLTYDEWFKQVGAGQSFVTNGPLLLCKANDKNPGHIFNTGKNIMIAAELFTRDSLDKIEIIRNGTIIKTLHAKDLKGNKFSSNISFDRSGWFMVRVLCKVEGNFRFAATAPWYVETGAEKKYISRSAAQYFLNWTNERGTSVKGSEKQLEEINRYINQARMFWEDLVAIANAD